MGRIGDNLAGAKLDQGLCRRAQCARSIDHIVDQNAGAIADIADDVHDLSLIGARTALIDDRQIGAQLLSDGARADHTADIGRDDDHIFIALLLDVVEQNWRAIDVIDWDAEKPLNLFGVQVDR